MPVHFARIFSTSKQNHFKIHDIIIFSHSQCNDIFSFTKEVPPVDFVKSCTVDICKCMLSGEALSNVLQICVVDPKKPLAGVEN